MFKQLLSCFHCLFFNTYVNVFGLPGNFFNKKLRGGREKMFLKQYIFLFSVLFFLHHPVRLMEILNITVERSSSQTLLINETNKNVPEKESWREDYL